MARVFGLVCRWSAVGLFPLMLCCAMCALLSAIIWCTRVIMRCNRFPVSGGVVVLPCVLSCDCDAFYKCLSCCLLMAGWFARSCRAVCCWCGLCWFASVACCWCENGAYWLYVCRYIFIYWWCWCGLWRVLVLVWCVVCWLVVCVWDVCNKSRFVPCGVVVYICIYVYNALVAVLVVVWWWSARVYMDRYI